MPDLSLFPPSAAIAGDDLQVGGCSLREIAERFGTPAYVIDEQALRSRAREYLAAFTRRHPRSRVCFAVKAYPSASMISLLAREGLGFDVVGGGELRIALAAGADPATIVMHGNAKTDDDIQAALDARIGYIVVDGFDDIDRIEKFARERTPVLLRVSPGIDSDTHAAMATGGTTSKFGVPLAQVPQAIARMREVPAIDLQGLHAHIGSQILTLEQFEAEVAALAGLERFGVYDLGGGLGVRYVPEDVAPGIDEYAERLVAAAHRHLGRDIDLIAEPGRSLVAPAGLTLYRVVTVKQHRPGARRGRRRDGGQPGALAVRPALRAHGGRPLGRGNGDRRPGRAPLRVRRRHHARRPAGQPADRRPDRGARHRRVLLHHGQQLQRRAAPAGHLLRRRHGAASPSAARPTPT